MLGRKALPVPNLTLALYKTTAALHSTMALGAGSAAIGAGNATISNTFPYQWQRSAGRYPIFHCAKHRCLMNIFPYFRRKPPSPRDLVHTPLPWAMSTAMVNLISSLQIEIPTTPACSWVMAMAPFKLNPPSPRELIHAPWPWVM